MQSDHERLKIVHLGYLGPVFENYYLIEPTVVSSIMTTKLWLVKHLTDISTNKVSSVAKIDLFTLNLMKP